MADFPFAAVGFDLDGTLLDTAGDLAAAVNHALALGGHAPVSLEASRELIGGGAKLMLARALDAQGGVPEPEFRRLYKAMLAFYGDHTAVHTVPFAGAAETLDALAARGVLLAVVTNKFESFARAALKGTGLLDHFDAVIGGDTLGKGTDGQYLAKPLAAPVLAARVATGGGTFAFLGDSTYDVRAARAAGVPVIAAAYGYCDVLPHELGADAVIGSFAELIPALECLPTPQTP